MHTILNDIKINIDRLNCSYASVADALAALASAALING